MPKNEAKVNVIRNKLIVVIVKTKGDNKFSRSTWTAQRKIKQYKLQNNAAARILFLKQEHKNTRISYSIQYLHQKNNFWAWVVFSDKTFLNLHLIEEYEYIDQE